MTSSSGMHWPSLGSSFEVGFVAVVMRLITSSPCDWSPTSNDARLTCREKHLCSRSAHRRSLARVILLLPLKLVSTRVLSGRNSSAGWAVDASHHKGNCDWRKTDRAALEHDCGWFCRVPRKMARGRKWQARKRINLLMIFCHCWWRGTVVERRSLTGELSLSCARPAAG